MMNCVTMVERRIPPAKQSAGSRLDVATRSSRLTDLQFPDAEERIRSDWVVAREFPATIGDGAQTVWQQARSRYPRTDWIHAFGGDRNRAPRMGVPHARPDSSADQKRASMSQCLIAGAGVSGVGGVNLRLG